MGSEMCIRDRFGTIKTSGEETTMSQIQPLRIRVRRALVTVIALATSHVYAQGNRYELVENWAQLPDGMVWGQVIAVDTDQAGNLIALHRCSSDTCVGQSEPPLLKFNPSGELLMSWGEGLLVWPHGLDIDADGNIWVTDGRHEGGKGEVIFKFSPDGEVLMTIGTPGISGDGPYTFDGVCDVVVAANGNIFVADGHVNNRVVKYSAAGRFLMAWGQAGTGPGEFDMPHSIDIDSQGRVFVADRGNNRVQIFDQEGRYLDEWSQFGRPSGVPERPLPRCGHKSPFARAVTGPRRTRPRPRALSDRPA